MATWNASGLLPLTTVYVRRMEEVPHLNVTIQDDAIEKVALEILEILRPQWNQHDVIFKHFTDGITNRLFGCSLAGNQEDVILIRSYGKNTELLIDREAEVKNFKLLHEYGYAPHLYATLNNGLAYEYVNGETLDEVTVKDPNIFPLVASMMARLHSIPVANDDQPVLWPKLWRYFGLLPSSFSSKLKRERFEKMFPLGLKGVESEISFLQANIPTTGLKSVFCHNDLLLANIIHSKGKVTFIDYEYADCNYQAFDIGNHFTEHAGVNDIDFSRIPEKDFQVTWLKIYLKELKLCSGDLNDVTSEEVEALYSQVNKFILISHIFWITWSLVQAEICELDFDFVEYAAAKMADYYARKSVIMPS